MSKFLYASVSSYEVNSGQLFNIAKIRKNGEKHDFSVCFFSLKKRKSKIAFGIGAEIVLFVLSL